MANRELNDVKINVEFQEAANRQQLSSGDEIKTLFGKIKKWFTDLKTVAFTGSYNDLLNKPTSMPASDVYEWAKQSTKPSYSKSDVGLANVPNVSTNDQTPTFTRSSSRSNITSGEKLSVMLGKISKFFYDLKTVAFTGMYSDLKRTPYVPKTCSVGNNDISGYKYFPILTVWPAGDETRSSGVVYFDIFNFDWDTSYERVAVHFASWDNTNAYYIDGMGCTSIYKSKNTIDYSGLLFGVSDSVDPFCIEVWIKVPQYYGFGIKLFAAGSYNYTTGETWTDYDDYGGDVLNSFVYVNSDPIGYTRANLPEYVTSKELFFGSLT